MFTDMVGYSTLSQRDDKLALELLEEHRRLLREIFPRFHGTEILPWESGGKPRSESRSAAKTRSPWNLAGAAALGLLVLLAVFWFTQHSGRERKTVRTQSSNATAAAAKTREQKSVAVLPFVNLSDEKGSEYFSDGISEELLTVLQKIPGMHVAARTSAFSFKGKNATAQEIGEKLGVAHLVEGSMRKSGDTVRIAARLTRADTGEELWSE